MRALETLLIALILCALGYLTAFAFKRPSTNEPRFQTVGQFQINDQNSDANQVEKSVLSNPSYLSQSASAAIGPDFLVSEIRGVTQLAPLANDPDVQKLLNFSKKNPEDIYAAEGHDGQIRLINAATRTALAVTNCLRHAADCGIEDLGTDYLTMGAHPLHLVLERALNIEKLGDADHLTGAEMLTNQQITDVLSVQQHNVAVLAIDLLTSRNLSSYDLDQIWSKGAEVKGHAKVLYFKMLSEYIEGDDRQVDRSAHQGLLTELDRTLADSTDAWTAVKVITSLENFKISEADFRTLARRACSIPVWTTEEDSRLRLLSNIESQARRLNFCLETSQGKTCDKSKPIHLTTANYCTGL
jgi:hypothetical protein